MLAVIGAGNDGCAMSGDLTLAGFEVHLTEMPRFADKLKPIRERGGLEVTGVARIGFAKLAKVTADIGDALDGATHLLLPLVAMAHEEVAGLCAPHLKDGQVIVLFPRNGGSLLFDKVLRERGLSRNVTLVEALTLPYATRLKGPPRSISIGPSPGIPLRRCRAAGPRRSRPTHSRSIRPSRRGTTSSRWRCATPISSRTRRPGS